MTSENAMYGPGWLKCVVCGVTVPLSTLKDTSSKPATYQCIDAEKCAQGKAHFERERAEFELQHPLLVVRK